MKIGCIIPDRGDRKYMMRNCLRMVNNQTIAINDICIIDYIPVDNDCDITPRYRKGYDYFRNKGFDVLFFIENDDYYAPNYVEMMLKAWEKHGKPDLFGTNYTYYYHIQLLKYYIMEHFDRASAMNTLIKPDLQFYYCPDNEPYFDIHLWRQSNKRLDMTNITFTPDNIISLGIKHGIGKCGGRSHVDGFHRYINDDGNKDFLKRNMDNESFNFYTNYYDTRNSQVR